jgi:hypothetical protein
MLRVLQQWQTPVERTRARQWPRAPVQFLHKGEGRSDRRSHQKKKTNGGAAAAHQSSGRDSQVLKVDGIRPVCSDGARLGDLHGQR